MSHSLIYVSLSCLPLFLLPVPSFRLSPPLSIVSRSFINLFTVFRVVFYLFLYISCLATHHLLSPARYHLSLPLPLFSHHIYLFHSPFNAIPIPSSLLYYSLPSFLPLSDPFLPLSGRFSLVALYFHPSRRVSLSLPSLSFPSASRPLSRSLSSLPPPIPIHFAGPQSKASTPH